MSTKTLGQIFGVLSISVALLSCGLTKKEERSLAKLRQGQQGSPGDNGGGGGGGENPLSPAEKLKAFCKERNGKMTPDGGLCKHRLARVAPLNSELEEMPEQMRIPLAKTDRGFAIMAKRIDGTVYVEDKETGNVLARASQVEQWVDLPVGGDLELVIEPSYAKGVFVEVQQCTDQNFNSFPPCNW